MSALRQALEAYLALRRGLGSELRGPGAYLHRFVEFLDREGSAVVTTKLALRWATAPAGATPATWAQRLADVRRFATWLSATDPRTEIPPPGLLPARYRRRPPYIYSDEELRASSAGPQALHLPRARPRRRHLLVHRGRAGAPPARH